MDWKYISEIEEIRFSLVFDMMVDCSREEKERIHDSVQFMAIPRKKLRPILGLLKIHSLHFSIA